MSYTPTVWKKGDVITAARLNKIEEGVEDLYSKSGLIIYTETDPSTSGTRLSQTLRTIYNAVIAGTPVIVCCDTVSASYYPITEINYIESLEDTSVDKFITFGYDGGHFKASDPDSYPLEFYPE